MPTPKQLLADTTVTHIKHPQSPKEVYVEIVRDTKSKEATHFITHYAERVGNKERIDAKSQYDKSTDERWFSLNADALKKIVALRDTKHTPHSKVEVVNVKTLEKHLAGVDMDKSKNETTSKVVDFSEFVDKTKS